MLCDLCRPQVPKECRRPVEDPEMLSTTCSRECKNGHCTPTGKCCCSPGWDDPFCLRGMWDNTRSFTLCSLKLLSPSPPNCTGAGAQKNIQFSRVPYSQVWTKLSQRRGLRGTQQMSLQRRLLGGSVRERGAWRARGRWERQHTGANHWHDLLPTGPHQLYCIKRRWGW